MQRQLVEQAIAGDLSSFEALVRSSSARQYAVATLILRDPDRAHDAVQEALLAAWRDLSALRDPDAWDAWLHRLTVRACYRAARRHRQRSTVELPPSPDFDLPVDDDAPGAIAERDHVQRQLAVLPIEIRTVMVLHYFVGLPMTEVAMVVGLPEGTVKSRLHRGLETLRRRMGVHPVTSTRTQERPA